jgi:RNA polymerase primary sigma factor
MIFMRRSAMTKKMLDNVSASSSDVNFLSMYLKEIDRIPLLSRDEEYELAKKASKGDEVARNRLVEANLRFVISVAKKFQNRGIPLSDLVNEGNIGLMTAVEKFDPDKGYHFISYAVWWIRQAIMKALSDKVRMIRLPMNKNADMVAILRARSEYEQETGEVASLEDISRMTNMEASDIGDLIGYSSEVTSLDSPVAGSADSVFGDFIESEEPLPEDHLESLDLKDSINKVLDKLSPKERAIIELRFGLNNNHPMSLKDIGELYQLTKERIRQIEKKVLSNLSKDKDFVELKSFIA